MYIYYRINPICPILYSRKLPQENLTRIDKEFNDNSILTKSIQIQNERLNVIVWLNTTQNTF